MKDCKEKIITRKPGNDKWFDKNDERFYEDPFTICVTGIKKGEKTVW